MKYIHVVLMALVLLMSLAVGGVSVQAQSANGGMGASAS